MTSNKPFILREKDHLAWLKNHRDILEREKYEKDLIKAAKKRLKSIEKEKNKNEEWLRKQ